MNELRSVKDTGRGDGKGKTLKHAVLGLAAAAFVVTGVAVVTSSIADFVRTSAEIDQARSSLLAQANKSDAHQFVVYHWVRCTPLNSTPATCFSGIQRAAALRGEGFKLSVDRAVQSLGLI